MWAFEPCGTDLLVSADKVAVQEILVSTLSSLKFESDSPVRLVGEGRDQGPSTSWGLRTCLEVVLA